MQSEIEQLLKDYAWLRAHTHPEFGSPEEAVFGFDPATPPPVSEAELHARASALEASVTRLSAALDRAFDHLTAEPTRRRRVPLRWSHVVAVVIGGLAIFTCAELFSALLDPYIDAALDAARRWLNGILSRSG